MKHVFDWHPRKATLNRLKHSVAFEEAASVFGDPTAIAFHDEAHSHHEDRELIIGHSERNRLLVVSFTRRGPKTRIISARRATAKERRNYEQGSIQ